MKKTTSLLLAFAVTLLTGCFEIEDTFAVNKDGSGSWKFMMKLGPRMTAMMSSSDNNMKMDGEVLMKEKKLRAALAKAKGVKLVSYSVKNVGGSLTAKGEVSFDSIVDLYRIKELEEQLNWEFKKVGNRLEAEIKQGMMSSGDGDNDVTKQMDFKAVKGMMLGLKIDRVLIMPNPIESSTGNEKAAGRARWKFEINPETTEEQFKALNENKPKASCSAEGITFKLPLGPAGSVPTDLSAIASDGADMKAELDQIQIDALRAQIIRHTNYEKDSRMFFSSTPLTINAQVSWPAGMKPSGWSHLTIEEGSDNTGKALKLHRTRLDEKTHELKLRSNHENAAEIRMEISDPARTADSFSLKGAVLVHVPKALKTIAIPDIKSQLGKTLDAPGLEGFNLKVKSVQGTNIQLVGDQPNDSIVDLKFVSPDRSKELKRFYMNRSKFRDEHRLNAGFMSGGRDSIKEPTLVIVIAGEIGKYTVPFHFQNLKLP